MLTLGGSSWWRHVCTPLCFTGYVFVSKVTRSFTRISLVARSVFYLRVVYVSMNARQVRVPTISRRLLLSLWIHIGWLYSETDGNPSTWDVFNVQGCCHFVTVLCWYLYCCDVYLLCMSRFFWGHASKHTVNTQTFSNISHVNLQAT